MKTIRLTRSISIRTEEQPDQVEITVYPDSGVLLDVADNIGGHAIAYITLDRLEFMLCRAKELMNEVLHTTKVLHRSKFEQLVVDYSLEEYNDFDDHEAVSVDDLYDSWTWEENDCHG